MPMPRATARPTMAEFLKFKWAEDMSLMPVIAMEANTFTVAPPSTQ